MKFHWKWAALAVALGLAGLATGCGKDSTSSIVPRGSGTLSVRVTDDPVDLVQISHLYVTFDRLYLFPERAGQDSSGGHDARPTPIEVITNPITLDLVSLSNGLTAALGTASVPEGTYRSVNLVVSYSWAILANGDSVDVMIPSGDTRGLKIVTEFTVTSGGVSEITLDFNAAASLHEAPPGSGRYILRPVIRQLPDPALAATIAGHVWVQTDNGLVSAGDYLVPNPRLGHRGRDRGNGGGDFLDRGRRPGDDRDRGHAPPDTAWLRAQVPLTIAWPMVVTARPDSLSPGDSTNAPASPLAAQGSDSDHDRDPAHPNRPHLGATVVNRNGDYLLYRLRRDRTFNLALHLLPNAGFEVVSGPGAVFLGGNLTGQDFVVRKVTAP